MQQSLQRINAAAAAAAWPWARHQGSCMPGMQVGLVDAQQVAVAMHAAKRAPFMWIGVRSRDRLRAGPALRDAFPGGQKAHVLSFRTNRRTSDKAGNADFGRAPLESGNSTVFEVKGARRGCRSNEQSIDPRDSWTIAQICAHVRGGTKCILPDRRKVPKTMKVRANSGTDFAALSV